MNISLRRIFIDHCTDTYVPGTNGQTSVGIKTLTTSGAGFPVIDRQSFPLPVWFGLLTQYPVSFFISPCRGNIICYYYFVGLTHYHFLTCLSVKRNYSFWPYLEEMFGSVEELPMTRKNINLTKTWTNL